MSDFAYLLIQRDYIIQNRIEMAVFTALLTCFLFAVFKLLTIDFSYVVDGEQESIPVDMTKPQKVDYIDYDKKFELLEQFYDLAEQYIQEESYLISEEFNTKEVAKKNQQTKYALEKINDDIKNVLKNFIGNVDKDFIDVKLKHAYKSFYNNEYNIFYEGYNQRSQTQDIQFNFRIEFVKHKFIAKAVFDKNYGVYIVHIKIE